MYLPIPPQSDCASAWREAVRAVDQMPGRSAHNVIIDVVDPVVATNRQDSRIAVVDDFLRSLAKPLETVANTIFPAALYYRYGSPAFFEVFQTQILERVRRSARWSGYYFERMIQHPSPSGSPINQLLEVVCRMRDQRVRALNKFEIALFDPVRDVDSSPYGGQCLSFLSFKILPGTTRRLALTAQYRNHFYIEKLLGNLIGLGRLMAFVASETGLAVGPLTVISTHAEIDRPGRTRREELHAMISQFDQAAKESAAPSAAPEKGSSRAWPPRGLDAMP